MAEITVLHYQTAARRIPYQEWFDSLTDRLVKAAVLARVNRLRLGTFGDWESVGDGVSELRIHFGAGYRIYFGRHGQEVVILLAGGDKRSQDADIKTAKRYWKDYETRTKARTGGRSP
jgi:putative addiction module killer protein